MGHCFPGGLVHGVYPIFGMDHFQGGVKSALSYLGNFNDGAWFFHRQPVCSDSSLPEWGRLAEILDGKTGQ